MQTVPYVLGIAHPTGYPTYILLAAGFDRIPIGDVAFRANLLSGVCVAIAIGVTCLLLVRLGVRVSIAAAIALALGVVPTVWTSALVAEVNPLHLLLFALLIHRAVLWAQRPTRRDLAIGGTLLGLALGNHPLTLTVAPFLVAFVLWTGRWWFLRRPGTVIVGIVPASASLLTYLYIPLRAAQGPPLGYNHPDDVASFLDLVLGRQFSSQFAFLTLHGPANLLAGLGAIWVSLNGGTGVLVILGLAGLVLLVRHRRPLGVAMAGMLVAGLYVYANYGLLEHYLLGPLLVAAIGAGVALERIAVEVPRVVRRDVVRRAPRGLALATLTLPLWIAATGWVGADRSGDRDAATYVDDVFARLPANAAILSFWRATTPLWYAQHVEGRRPDVLIVDDSNIVFDGYGTRERAIAVLICERPVFIVRPSDADLIPVRDRFRLAVVGTVRVEVAGLGVIERPIDEVTPRGEGECPAPQATGVSAR